GGGHGGRFAQLAELRSSARHLHVCDHLRDLGRRLSLSRLARQTADTRLLGSRLAAVSTRRNRAGSRAAGARLSHALGGTDVYPKTVGAALVDAPAALLALRARCAHHLPAG